MEMNINLLKEKGKSSFRVILGISSVLIASVWIFIRIIGMEIIKPVDWIFFGFFALNGVFHFIEGLGYFFGKAYILINPESISIKASALDANQSVIWSEIEVIDYTPNILIITKTDNTTLRINLFRFNYVLINEIKKTVCYIANEKNVPANI